MYEEMCCVCVVSECPVVVLCAVVDSIVRYPIMCGSMAPLLLSRLHFACGAVEDLVVYGMLIASCAGSHH